MKQNYDHYTTEDHAVWQLLFTRQTANLQDKACPEYLQCLAQMSDVLHPDAIPDFNLLNELLLDSVSWQIEVVPGHIPVKDFFELLAQRRFPSSTWLRSRSQLDYLEEPDMFHDIYGHIPLLIDPRYADAMHILGQMGHEYIRHEKVINALRSLYWFTIEFGLVLSEGALRIYGAGILSSFGESKAIFNSDTIRYPFSLSEILATDFQTDKMQSQYFVAESMDQFLYHLNTLQTTIEGMEVIRANHLE